MYTVCMLKGTFMCMYKHFTAPKAYFKRIASTDAESELQMCKCIPMKYTVEEKQTLRPSVYANMCATCV